MKVFLLIIPLFLFANSYSLNSMQLSCYDSGQGPNCRMASVYPDAPLLYRAAIREIVVPSGTSWSLLPIAGLTQSGLPVIEDVQLSTIHRLSWKITYLVGPENKPWEVTFLASNSIPPNTSGANSVFYQVRDNWPQGKPSSFQGQSLNTMGFGLYADVDIKDYLKMGSYLSGPLRPLTNSVFDYNGKPVQGSNWVTGARWSQENGIYSSPTTNWDVRAYTFNGPDIFFKACTPNIAGATYSISTDCSIGSQQILTNSAVSSNLFPFVGPGGGIDNGAFMFGVSSFASSSVAYGFRGQLKIGKRSISLNWNYYEANHGDPNFKGYMDAAGTPKSVRDVLTSLVNFDSNNDVLITTARDATSNLKCSGYGNKDNTCTQQELFSLQARYIPNVDNPRLRANVNVLSNSSNHEFDNSLGTVTGVVYGGGSSAFVLPHYNNSNYVYKTIAHEIGHTFGMRHQWSNCNENDGGTGRWNCANGTIMSYADTPIMDFGADAKNWFIKAPEAWMDPSEQLILNNNTTEPNQLINW